MALTDVVVLVGDVNVTERRDDRPSFSPKPRRKTRSSRSRFPVVVTSMGRTDSPVLRGDPDGRGRAWSWAPSPVTLLCQP